MKIKTSLFVAAFFVLFSFSTAHASCTPPVPPACYTTTTVPVYTSIGTQPDGAVVYSNGTVLLPNGGGIVQSPTKQVQTPVNCSGTQQEIDYEAQQLTYQVCSQTSNHSSNSTTNLQLWSSNFAACQKVGHAYLDDSTDPNGQCTCYHGFSFNAQGQCVVTPQTLSPTSSCPSGSEGIFSSDGKFSCRTYSQGCQLKYGPNSWGDGTNCHICSSGYQVNSDNTACILGVVSNSLPAATTTSSVSVSAPIAKRTAVTPKLLLRTQILTDGSLISTTSTQASTSLGMTPAEAQAWIMDTPAPTPKQMHWYEWLNPINWFSWLK